MIIYRNHNRARPVYVIHSRLSVYTHYYGDGLGDLVSMLLTRVAPKTVSVGKESASKAIGAIQNKNVLVM